MSPRGRAEVATHEARWCRDGGGVRAVSLNMASRLAFLFLALSFFTGCSTHWRVVKQAEPNPLRGKKNFAVAAINYRGLRVGELTEQSYLATKKPEKRSKWVGDKRAINAKFAETLVSEAREAGLDVDAGGIGTFTIYPRVHFVEPGWYAFTYRKPGQIRMRLVIVDSQGDVVDEIKLRASSESSATVRGRFEDVAEDLGSIVADYLKERVSVDD